MERDLAQNLSDICLRLERLAGHRWETHALLRLSEAAQPPRRSTLKRAISSAAGEPVADNTLGAVLDRLQHQGEVQWQLDEECHKVFLLTPHGRCRVVLLIRALRAVEHNEPCSSRG